MPPGLAIWCQPVRHTDCGMPRYKIYQIEMQNLWMLETWACTGDQAQCELSTMCKGWCQCPQGCCPHPTMSDRQPCILWHILTWFNSTSASLVFHQFPPQNFSLNFSQEWCQTLICVFLDWNTFSHWSFLQFCRVRLPVWGQASHCCRLVEAFHNNLASATHSPVNFTVVTIITVVTVSQSVSQ